LNPNDFKGYAMFFGGPAPSWLDTTSPNARIDSIGNFVFNSGSGGDNYFNYDNRATRANYFEGVNHFNLFDTSKNSIFYGNVGIGTTSPGTYGAVQSKLDVSTAGHTNLAVTTLGTSNVARLTLNAPSSSWLIDNRGGFDAPTNRLSFNYNNGNELMTILSGGNVGIGTTSPGTILHLVNSSSATLKIENTGGAIGGIIQLKRGGTDVGASHFLGGLDFNANVSGVDKWMARISAISVGANAQQSLLQFSTANNADATVKMTIDKDGNVGIGTTSPSYPLVVGNGGMEINRDSNEPYLIYSYSGSDVAQVRGITGGGLRFTNGTASTEWMRLDSSGNVGIGTTTPLVKLGVYYTGSNIATLIKGAGAGAVGIGSDGNGGTIQGYTSDTAVAFDDLLLNAGGGNVGIGTTTPGYTLSVAGTILQTNAKNCALSGDAFGAIGCTSDERLKDIHGFYEGGVAEIMNVNPIEFNYKGQGYTHVGFSAQNVNGVLPEATPIQDSGFFGLDSNALIALSVNAIKEQQAVINRATTTIAVLASTTEMLVSASSSVTSLHEGDTFWSRLTQLVSSFVDGVLTLVGIDAEEVNTNVLCIGETCVDEATLKALLQGSGQTTSGTTSTAGNTATGTTTVTDSGTATTTEITGTSTTTNTTSGDSSPTGDTSSPPLDSGGGTETLLPAPEVPPEPPPLDTTTQVTNPEPAPEPLPDSAPLP
jgi:hypothetical protein